MKALQPGNTFVIWKLGRHERDLMQLVPIIDKLHGRNVGFRVQARRSTRQRRMADWSLSLAEFERELIAERA